MIRRPLILACIGSVCIVSAQTSSSPQSLPAFEVASVRANTGSDLSIPISPTPPDGITFTNYPLESIIRYAYSVQGFRVVGMPRWALDERFDITAKAAGPIDDAQRRLMVRSLLVDRFRLRAHFESREQETYVMTAARADRSLGPGLRLRADCATNPCGTSGSSSRVAGVIRVKAITLGRLADGTLSNLLDRVVRDETGIPGTFDAELSWRPDTGPPEDARPSFFTALQEQFGLKLAVQRRPVDVLVIASLERPTPE